MSLPDAIIFELSRGVASPFADWPILLCRCSARACTQSGITRAASSTWECLDEGSPPRPSVEIRLWASIRACTATPVDAEAETGSEFMSPTGLSCRRYPKKT